MLCMHILIPILTVTSFTLNDSPLGKLHFTELLLGIWVVTIYAALVIILIQSGMITSDKIPYFFLDFKHMSRLMIVIGFVFIYGLSLLLSFVLSESNRKLYWLWFKNLPVGNIHRNGE